MIPLAWIIGVVVRIVMGLRCITYIINMLNWLCHRLDSLTLFTFLSFFNIDHITLPKLIVLWLTTHSLSYSKLLLKLLKLWLHPHHTHEMTCLDLPEKCTIDNYWWPFLQSNLKLLLASYCSNCLHMLHQSSVLHSSTHYRMSALTAM